MAPNLSQIASRIRDALCPTDMPDPYVPNCDYAMLEQRVLFSAAPLDIGEFELQDLDPILDPFVDAPSDPFDEAFLSQIDQHLDTTEFDSDSLAAEFFRDSHQLSHASPLQLVVIDGNVGGGDELVADLLAKHDGNVEILELDANEDGVAQITNAMAGKSVSALHIVSHGEEGAVQLGNSSLDGDSLFGYVGQVVSWRSALTSDADILFYGCDLASTEDGRELLELIGSLCDCDVAASDDLTGHEDLGGDWEFEFKLGNIESEIVFSDAFTASWFSTLDITSNLVAHYEFEENGGATATDSTANNNDGSWINAPSWNGDSAVGSFSLDFTGDAVNANEVVTVPDDPSLNFDGDFTVAFWYNASTAQSNATRLIGSHDGDDGFSIYANADGSLNFFVDADDGATTATLSSGLVADGNWHLVVATRSGNSIDLNLDNGASSAGSGTTLGELEVAAPLTIGGESATVSDYEGLLDDVRIYTRQLSVSDVAELYATGSTTLTVDTFNDTLDGDTTSISTLLSNRGADGFISLREAVIAANNTAGADTIVLGSGTYAITRNGAGESFASTGDLDIRSDITITGVNGAQTIISGSGTSDGIFQIHSGNSLTLNQLAVADGHVSGDGGAIQNAGVFNANDVVIRDNFATGAGGAITSSGTTNLSRVSIYDNTASSLGGGIYQTGGTLNLTNVVVSGNGGTTHGGAIFINGGTATISYSTVAENSTRL